LFDIVKAEKMQASRVARITVNYLGSPYSVANLAEKAPSSPERHDHSLQALALLNQLVNASKHSEDLPTPRTLQVLP